MAKRKKKRRIRIKGVIRLTIIIALIVFFAYKLYQWNQTDFDATYNLEYAEINVMGEYSALIIRNEVLITASSSGKLTQVEDDGSKVKVNQRIMDITGVDDAEVAESSADVMVTDLQVSSQELDQMIQQIKVDIAERVRRGEYADVDELSEELLLKIGNRNSTMDQNDAIETLSLGSDSLDIGEKSPLITPVSGILSYYIDGHEEQFQYNNVPNLRFDEIEEAALDPFVAAPLYVNEGDVVAKIVEDSEYYLLIIVSQSEYNKFDVYRDIIIDVGEKNITGTIENYFSTGSKIAIAVKVDQQFEDHYKKRKIDVTIKQETYQGLSVEKSSLIKTDTGYAVYVVDKLNKVQMVPVKIVQYYDERAIVKSDFYYEFVDEERRKVETVSVYDEVIRVQEDYKPGDIVK